MIHYVLCALQYEVCGLLKLRMKDGKVPLDEQSSQLLETVSTLIIDRLASAVVRCRANTRMLPWGFGPGHHYRV